MIWTDHISVAGDTDYSVIGDNYTKYRKPEPAIAALIKTALGPVTTVLNVGAGAGSYEPSYCAVTAVEPSAIMRAQRRDDLPAAIDAVAENLPFPDRHFDASMATFTVHQWRNLARGLAEMRRVTTGPIVILSCDPTRICDFWLNEYAPDVLETEASRYPEINAIGLVLGGRIDVIDVPIPLRCVDGFNEAYYGRPEHFLDAGARQACSAWSFVESLNVERSIAHLRTDLATGVWDGRHGHLRDQSQFIGSLRLIISQP